jgi:pyruvate-ferredoxin/flavodoxin oxidoreductase
MVVANATGCSSIYGGNLPTTPYTKNEEGRGPAWSNSLFEDNAEFGLGFRVSLDKHAEQARELVARLQDKIGSELATSLISADQSTEAGIYAQRERIEKLRKLLPGIQSAEARNLESLADYLAKKSVWIIGGDGWAYDIGFGGVDHVLASGRNVNILVVDTEVYSNTGGQMSKATPLGAIAKFAAGGKQTGKKDLGLIAMSYGHVYVAQVAYGAKDIQTLKTFLEAETFDGPSLIIAYSPCIEHGYDLSHQHQQQEMAVSTGHWPLYRYDPRNRLQGKNPLTLDSAKPSVSYSEFIQKESRFRGLVKEMGDDSGKILASYDDELQKHYAHLEQMAANSDEGVKKPG